MTTNRFLQMFLNEAMTAHREGEFSLGIVMSV